MGYTLLQLNMDGDNNSTTFADISPFGHSVTATGDAKISTASSQFNGSSLYLDGNGDYLSVGVISTELDLGTANWTIEFFTDCQDQSLNYPAIVSSGGSWGTGAFGIRFDNTGRASKFSVHWYELGDPFIASASTYSFGVWRHVALCRNNTSVKLWVAGAEAASGTISASQTLNLSRGNAMRIGHSAWDGSNGYYKGYVDALRITLGEALYTAAFTPPTELFSHPDPFYVRLVAPKRLNPYFGGGHRIAGTAAKLGAVGAYNVLLYDRRSGMLLARTVSASNGTFSFDGLEYRPNGYRLVAEDGATVSPLNAAVADLITPVVMP